MVHLASMAIITTAVGHAAMSMASPRAPVLPPPTPEEREALLNQYGLSKGTILQSLSNLLGAERVIIYDNEAIGIPDNSTRVKATELGLKLHGMIDKHDEGPRVGTINIMWAGGVPPWAQSNDNQLVKAEECIPISTIEGTESAPAAVAPTRPVKKLKSKSGTLSSRVSRSKQQ